MVLSEEKSEVHFSFKSTSERVPKGNLREGYEQYLINTISGRNQEWLSQIIQTIAFVKSALTELHYEQNNIQNHQTHSAAFLQAKTKNLGIKVDSPN